MTYRTKTYIAAEWDGDSCAVEQLRKWNESNYWSMSFVDAHDLTQARDSSLSCSIKASLRTRLEASKTFILIVGNNTVTARSGSCQYCNSYNSYSGICMRGHGLDFRSYIEYECAKAIMDGLNVIVLYNSAAVNKSKCPSVLRDVGTHAAMCYRENGNLYWNYNAVKDAMA